MWISVVELCILSLLSTLVHKVQSLISYHPSNGFDYILWFGSWCLVFVSLYLPWGLSNAHTTSWLWSCERNYKLQIVKGIQLWM